MADLPSRTFFCHYRYGVLSAQVRRQCARWSPGHTRSKAEEGPRIDTLATIDTSALNERAEAAALILKSFANPVYLKMRCAMADGEQSVGAIAQKVGVRETMVSQHLM